MYRQEFFDKKKWSTSRIRNFEAYIVIIYGHSAVRCMYFLMYKFWEIMFIVNYVIKSDF